MRERRFDRGSGPPVVVIPGIQGRWEWMEPALDRMSASCRVVSYSLCGEPGSGMPFEASAGFDNFVRQLDDVLERTGLESPALCGVSFGGFIALRYAALRPGRVRALILVSAPPPEWTPTARQRRHLARPMLEFPLFAAGAFQRFWREMRTSLPSWPARLEFAAVHGLRVVRAPLVPTSAAARVAAQQATDMRDDCARIEAPTLVIAGEDDLDDVVPPQATRRYVSLIPGARFERLEGTGHLGVLTRPERFVRLVTDFVHANHH
jgi:pimeloyl-ACP methyl ester carboxylesterase